MADDLMVADGLVVSYPRPRGLFARGPQSTTILHGVDIRVGRGETVGIVGESGSGKTTLGRALLGLVTPASGTVVFDGTTINTLDERRRQPFRRRMQMIFQDPMSSLNPRHTVGRILIEPILLHRLAKTRAAALDLVHQVLDRVGLSRVSVDRYSYELSGGQRQRVGIARAVVLRPDFVLADEIVSGLDVSTQAQVLRLLKELDRRNAFGARLYQPRSLGDPLDLSARGGDARRSRGRGGAVRPRIRGAGRRLYADADRCHSAALGRSRLADPRRWCRGGGYRLS